jgi:hypothetical protein
MKTHENFMLPNIFKEFGENGKKITTKVIF